MRWSYEPHGVARYRRNHFPPASVRGGHTCTPGYERSGPPARNMTRRMPCWLRLRQGRKRQRFASRIPIPLRTPPSPVAGRSPSTGFLSACPCCLSTCRTGRRSRFRPCPRRTSVPARRWRCHPNQRCPGRRLGPRWSRDRRCSRWPLRRESPGFRCRQRRGF